MDRGWIKLHRKLRENPMWYSGKFDKGKAWVDMLLRANHTEKKVLIGNKLYTVKPGEFITSQKKLSHEWGWSRHKVIDFISLLETVQQIEHVSNSLFTKISITCWGDYQNSEHQKDIKRTSKGHQKDTNKNDKECKEEYIEVITDPSGGENSPPNQKIPYEEIRKIYNRIAGGSFGECRVISSGRQKHLRPFYKLLEKAGVTVEDYFTRAVASEFLKNGSASRPWRATFDWLVNQNNAAKVIGGNYDTKIKPAEPIKNNLTRQQKDSIMRLYEGMLSDGDREKADAYRKMRMMSDGYDPKLDKEV